MCLAVPMVLTERGAHEGVVEMGGVTRTVSLILLPEAAVGDHLLVHAGYAIGKVDPEEARLTLHYLEQMAQGRPGE